MDSRFAHWKRPPVLAAGVFVAVFSVQVQYAPLQAGQRIWFSSPRNDTVSSNVPTLSPKPLKPPDFKDSSDAPLPFEFNEPPAAPPPLSGKLTISPAEQAQMQDVSDRRKNWILLTPAEILGATTPEKILGIQEHDASGRPKKLTALERYIERQNQLLAANTNAIKNDDSSTARTFSRNRRDPSDTFNSTNRESENPASMANPPLNSGSDNPMLAKQSQNGDRANLFDSPTPSSTPNTAEQGNMERFRQLLGSSPSPALAATPSSNDKISSLLGLSPDAKQGQPSLDPIGTLYGPLNSGIGRPADLPTFSGTLGLNYKSSRPAAVWTPQPPPWMSADPQPFAVPQRKF